MVDVGREPASRAGVAGYDNRGGNALIVEFHTPEGERLARWVKPKKEELGALLDGAFALYDRSRKEFHDYLFSFRPADPADGKRVAALVAKFTEASIDARAAAAKDLAAMGRPAFAALQSLDRSGLDAETLSRVDGVVKELSHWNRLTEGLEHDVPYLARLADPRAHARLKRVLAKVRPFAKDGVPEAGAKLDEYLRGWWEYSKDRVRWDAEKDRFEER